MAQKESNCQEVSARMMELLYGELSGDDRAAVEAHLVGCASCRAELAGFESTRAAARRALDADEPPQRAHQAILHAAAAVTTKQPQPIEAHAVASRPSFWERWRARWTLPTFATIGAVAVVVLASKIFLEPEKTVELGRQALQSAPAEAPAEAPVLGTKQPEAQEETKIAAHPKAEMREPEPPAGDKSPARSIATPKPAERRREAPSDRFGAVGGLMKGGGAASSGRAKSPASDALSLAEDKALAPPAAPKPAKREFAPPPPPRAEPARPSAPAANQMRERDTRDTEGKSLEETVAAPRGGVGHLAAGGAAPPAAHAKAKKVGIPLSSGMDDLDRGPAPSAAAPAPAPAAPAAEAESKADANSETRAASKPVAESPIARADRLFAQGQWAAAARAYRELLRRDPHNGDAARWRQRLAASEEAASAQAPAAASPRR